MNLLPAEFFGGPPGTFAEVKFGSQHNLTFEGTASQLIFDGTYFVGLRASKTVKLLNNQQSEKARRTVRNRTSEAYYNALVAKRNHTILSRIQANFEERFREIRAQFEEGMVEEQQKDQVELNVLSLENQTNSARRNASLAKRNLKLVMGMPLKTPITLTDSLEPLLSDIDPEVLAEKEFTPDQHIDHRLSKTQVMLKELEVDRQRMGFYPKVNGFITHRQNAQRDEFNFLDQDKKWFPSTLFGVNLSIPIFHSGQRVADLQKAKLSLKKARIRQKETTEQLKLRVDRAKTRYINARESLRNDRKSLELARDIMDKTLVKHREGMATSLNLTQVKEQLLQAQQQYINTVREVLQAHSDLKKALADQ